MPFDEYGAELMKAPVTLEKPWWQPLISLVNFVLLGYCLKTYFGWDRNKTGTFRRFTFNILLPIYVFRNMWVTSIDSSMYSIARTSLLIHVAQAVFWAFLYRGVSDKCMRGWLMMISQGCLTSLFYANLTAHSAFAQQAVAVCLLFDIGGNTPCAQGLLWGLAAYFAPDQTTQPPSVSFETAYSSPLLLRRPAHSHQCGELRDLTGPFTLRPANLGKARLVDVEFTGSDYPELRSLLGDHHDEPSDSTKSWQEIVFAVLYQPILPAFGLGLALSLYDVGCPVAVDYVMEGIGLLFKPCLYFLIGLYCEMITNFLQFKIVMTALSLRYLFSGCVAIMMWLWLPYGDLERTTMALSLLSPVSTMTMYLAAEYNYPTQYMAMSATLTTISVFISFLIQEGVMRSY